VLCEGVVATGMPLLVINRPHAEWTVDKANHIMHHNKENFSAAVCLTEIPPFRRVGEILCKSSSHDV
jgi:MOSC domain-containing protein YiiM